MKFQFKRTLIYTFRLCNKQAYVQYINEALMEWHENTLKYFNRADCIYWLLYCLQLLIDTY